MASANEKEELQLLQIFPNEVWQNILENVNEVEDYLHISSASHHFRNRMQSRATRILFPAVIKILTEQNPNPESFRWIKTRQVCQSWKQGLDKILQTQEYFIQHEDQKLSDMKGIIYVNKPVLADMPSFSSVDKLTQFQEYFDHTHLASGANPFLRRKIELFVTNGNLYYAACLQFLEKYGHHIWYCLITYDFDERALLAEFFCRRRQPILQRMPNLRALHIESAIDSYDLPYRSAVLIPNLFPTLPDLEFVFFSGPPFSIVRELLQQNPHVQYVDALSSAVDISFVLEALPNLRALAFTLEDHEDVMALEYAQFTSRVKRMWLDLTDLSTYEQVYSTLHRHFSESLHELHLRLSRNVNLTEETRLEFAQLKILYLEMVKPQRLELLLPLKDTLEELHLTFDCEPNSQVNCRFELVGPEQEERDRNKFQVYTFWKQPHKSNIWSCLQKLRVLEIKLFKGMHPPEKYYCTRREWQAEMETKK